MKRFKIVVLVLFLMIQIGILNHTIANNASANQPVKVEIKKEGDDYVLYRAGKPYFIKGAVGWDKLDELVAAGANSLRSSPKMLDEAHNKGLTVLVNLPVAAERSGFDYNDEKAVREQFDKAIRIVEEYKNHPAVLMWAIGNELDHIPGEKPYNLKVWNAVNQIAGRIKEVDPNHPVLTVVGYGMLEKIEDIKERSPNLDLLGINAYASVVNVPEWLSKYGWNKPYAVTEWGPSGWWEVPRTKTGVVIEETSSEKASVYGERYDKVILGDPRCVGSYVFLWTSNRQERTHTWFNMFHNDLRTQTVEVMQHKWTGKYPANRVPQVHGITINGNNALDHVVLKPGSVNKAQVDLNDPDQDALRLEWEILPEPRQFGAYAGQGEVKPEPVASGKQPAGEISFNTPEETGRDYRLFVYVYDDHGNIGVANIPFHVPEEK